MRPRAEPTREGQESAWDYPRPPRVERVTKHVRILKGGIVIADTHGAMRVLETSHPPVYYLPPQDICMERLTRTAGSSFCEWKGSAVYWDVNGATRAAWSYPSPTAAFESIRDFVAFYAGAMDECTVGGERVTPQPGGFYGGWITSDVVGPFKGEPGSVGW